MVVHSIGFRIFSRLRAIQLWHIMMCACVCKVVKKELCSVCGYVCDTRGHCTVCLMKQVARQTQMQHIGHCTSTRYWCCPLLSTKVTFSRLGLQTCRTLPCHIDVMYEPLCMPRMVSRRDVRHPTPRTSQGTCYETYSHNDKSMRHRANTHIYTHLKKQSTCMNH